MQDTDLTIEICGTSGDGTIAAGNLLNEALSQAGYSVMAFDSYPAEIRGFGRCVTRSRFGLGRILALTNQTHVLISLDDEQSLSRIPFLAESATVLFDNKPASPVPEGTSIAANVAPDANLYGIPFRDLASGASGSTRGKNLAALGGFAGLFGIDPELFYRVIKNKFQPKGDSVLTSNLRSFEAGLKCGLDAAGDIRQRFPAPPPTDPTRKTILLSGNAAIARGALDAGLQLYFGYPITPATPIMEHLARTLPEKGGMVMQMEDEIASIGAVLGSFFAGQRAMTATSGPGLALMTELISLGVMSETPAVILDAQRGGPSTGLPTKTEQSDLHTAVFGGPGDSPRIVIAPTNVTECYEYTLKSFQIAETYQTPVIILSDFFLDNRVENITPPAADAADTADGNLYPPESDRGSYKRYRATANGISPRAVPAMEGFVFAATGLEHSESGNPEYDPENHANMNSKRHTKIRHALATLPAPREFHALGSIDVGVIAWGSTFGAALEAVEAARAQGHKVAALKVTSIYPFHAEEIAAFMSRCAHVLVPELNFQGQLANLIGHLRAGPLTRLNRTTGVPLIPSEIREKIFEILQGQGRP